MKFTDIFIRRPVLATVVSLLILVLGLRSVFTLPVLQYPRTQNAVVTITTLYPGADPDVVAGFITTPLENSVAQANGIDYITSTSLQGVSTITANLRLNYNPDEALTEINTKVNAVLNQLPQGSQQPTLTVKIGETIDSMYIGFRSDVLPSNNITDYLLRVVQPKLQSLEGVQTAELIGQKQFALRAWLDPDKMAAHGLTGTDVRQALAANNFTSAIGNAKGQMVQMSLTASTGLTSLEGFRDMVVKQKGGAIVRLRDIATVTLGAQDYESQVSFDGQKAVYIGIQVAPNANLLEVVKRVRDAFPAIEEQLPQGIQGTIVYDATEFVNSAIHEVVFTLIEAVLIVTLVVFAFIGSPRSVLIPVVTIPLSLIGTFTAMLILGYSINLLTLLALVLAIGLVVDDAIIVVENVNRHLEEGMKPVPAAIRAARELATPIVAMTIVLVAVYIPIGFQGGLTGALFSEFAFTLVGAVTISGIVALTLSPMMSSRLLKPHTHDRTSWEMRTVDFIDRNFDRLRKRYARALHASLDTLAVTGVFALIILGSIYFLFTGSKTELAPQEDAGLVIAFVTPPANATLQQKQLYDDQIYKILSGHPETKLVFQLDTPSRVVAGMVLKPWDQRKLTTNQLQPVVQDELNQVAGAQVFAFQLPPLPGATGLPVQFVIQTTDSFDRLNEVSQEFLQAAQKSGMFIVLNNDLRFDSPQTEVVIDREKAAMLGLSMQDIGSALGSMLGGGYVNYFNFAGRSYQVIPQAERRARLNADQLRSYYIRTSSGASVPLSTVATLQTKAIPQSLNHFQQLNSATIQGVPMPGVTLGAALDYLNGLARDTLPAGYSVDYAGQARQFVQESSGFVVTFAFALIIIFLALSAQFESFRDPVIILISVPMSIAGALLFIFLGVGGATLNIYTEVGLVTLMGLISKHGILMVEFANNMQRDGMSKREAIEHAAAIRLRPILMTTAAMVMGVVPLILASGAGAVSRFSMGLVIATGLSIGTLFTLFVVPAVYMMIAADHSKHAEAEETVPA
ncbi:MAG: efflux RND transporter permease subunit [Gemmatimonas sp.]